MGSIYQKGRKLYASIKSASGDWTNVSTTFVVGQEREAKRFLRDLESRVRAGIDHGEADEGPLTLARFATRWIADRRKLGLAAAEDDEAKLRDHVLPAIGALPIVEIRARHLVALFAKLRAPGKYAPKTIYNIYSTVKALFRDAQMADLIDATPCVLSRYQLGANVDKDSEWRASAVYSRDELALLISDPRLPPDRRVLYALFGLGALRHGEAAGLRWRHYDDAQTPLACLLVATSYDKGRTKTGVTRRMPVHPVLAQSLAAWKRDGWARHMGRSPTADDLIVPLRPEDVARRRDAREDGGMRNTSYSFKRLRDDLITLGLRHRRGHDLRRTMITLARTDGARRDILELCTHNPKKGGGAIDLYTTFPWASLCEEVAKLQLAKTVENPSRPPQQNRRLRREVSYRFPTVRKNTSDLSALNGGGGGSRTRVRKRLKAAHYVRVRRI